MGVVFAASPEAWGAEAPPTFEAGVGEPCEKAERGRRLERMKGRRDFVFINAIRFDDYARASSITKVDELDCANRRNERKSMS